MELFILDFPVDFNVSGVLVAENESSFKFDFTYSQTLPEKPGLQIHV